MRGPLPRNLGRSSSTQRSPSFPRGLGPGGLPPSPPLPPLPATSSSADWPTLGTMRNSHSNKVPGPPCAGQQADSRVLGAVGTVVRVRGFTPWKSENWKEGPLEGAPGPLLPSSDHGVLFLREASRSSAPPSFLGPSPGPGEAPPFCLVGALQPSPLALTPEPPAPPRRTAPPPAAKHPLLPGASPGAAGFPA